MPRAELLIVHHGDERLHLKEALDVLAACDPELSARLRFHTTGSRTEPDLDGTRAVVFWLRDPLRESFPDCYDEAVALAERARAAGIALVNPPEVLSNSIKSRQARLWREAGVPTPAHTAFASRDELASVLAEHDYPLLIKADTLHGQQGMHLCRSRDEALAIPAREIYTPGSVAEFFEVRDGFAKTRPESVWARYYHKKRVIVFGDRIHPRHVFFSKNPVVGIHRSTFQPYKRLPAPLTRLALGLFPAHRAAIEEDVSFARAEPEHPELILQAAKALGMASVALDYASTADGGIVFWEANPTIHLPRADRYCLAEQRRRDERFEGFVRALARFFRDLLEAER